MTIRLSVLDLAPVGTGFGAAEALRRSTALALRAEQLGYSRFWIAEHHNIPAIASTAPEVLIAHVGALTHSIRVGSGGVMLPNHSPLAVAERFGMLEALYPGRIDLGLGRAPGTDRLTAFALGMRSPERFPEEVNEIRAMLHGDPARLRAVAGPHSAPELWVLGSSGDGARIAALLGVGYAHAHHIGPNSTVAAVDLYRREFRPSAGLEAPRALVALAAVAAETDIEARRQTAPLGINIARLRGGTPSALLSAAEAESIVLSPRDKAVADRYLEDVLIGDGDAVLAGLDELRARAQADEMMIMTMLHDHEARIRSHELIAEAAGLAGHVSSEQPATQQADHV